MTCLFLFSAVFLTSSVVMARDEYPGRILTRGEVVTRVITSFDLGQREKSFLSACRAQPHDCFFVFSVMSDFDEIAFEPFLQLYPDVNKKSRYYDAITTASMLGLVHGFMDEESTPFKPEVVMTRIQSLKIVLGAADLLEWKERFELGETQSRQRRHYVDTELSTPENWWYSRYMEFGYEHDITPHEDFFRPNDSITSVELQEMLKSTHRYLEMRSYNSKAVAQKDLRG